MLTDCLDSDKKSFYYQNNISILFKNIIESNDNTIIFFKLDSTENDVLSNVLNISSKMISNSNKKSENTTVKKRKISSFWRFIFRKKLQNKSFKILKPKVSLKTDDDLPSLRTNNSPKKNIINLNIDDISDSILCKRTQNYDYKKNFILFHH